MSGRSEPLAPEPSMGLFPGCCLCVHRGHGQWEAGILALTQPPSPGSQAGVGTQSQTTPLCTAPAKRLCLAITGPVPSGRTCQPCPRTSWCLPQGADLSQNSPPGCVHTAPGGPWPSRHPQARLSAPSRDLPRAPVFMAPRGTEEMPDGPQLPAGTSLRKHPLLLTCTGVSAHSP